MRLAISVMISLGVILIIVALVIAMLRDLTFDRSEVVIGLYAKDDIEGLQQVDINGFAVTLSTYWPECNGTVTAYVTGDGELTKQRLFAVYRNLSWCNDVQSANMSCGVREDVSMRDIPLPAVVTITCANNTLLIE